MKVTLLTKLSTLDYLNKVVESNRKRSTILTQDLANLLIDHSKMVAALEETRVATIIEPATKRERLT